MDAAGPPPRAEAGLREQFELMTAALAGPEQAQLARALGLVTRLHRADQWGTQPYLNHLMRVAIRIGSEYRVRDAEVLCAALLHDAVEDHPWRLSRAMELATTDGWAVPDPPLAPPAPSASATTTALDRLAAWFGPRVADLVEAVTNPPYDRGGDTHQQYRDHLRVSLRASPWARVLKAADFTDNAGGLIQATAPRMRRTAEKYRSVAPILLDLLALPDTPLPEHIRQHVRSQLTHIETRLTDLLAQPT